MRTIDFTPLYRSAVGFDRLAALLDAAAATDSASGYPPYNIERTDENAYRIEIAVAGFKPEELTIEAKENTLTVQGPVRLRAARLDAAGDHRFAMAWAIAAALVPEGGGNTVIDGADAAWNKNGVPATSSNSRVSE